MRRGAQNGGRMALGLLLALSPVVLPAQKGTPAPSAPPSRAGSPPPPTSFRPARPAAGAHLPQWFAQHQNLRPEQQDDALRKEPGFTRLPATQQNQVINRLHRLDTLPPAQRQRMMERNERFEALPPARREAIRAASQTLGQMPPDRREAVRDAFRDLRAIPPDQRQSALGSARFQAEYTPGERGVLSDLLSIEPYHAANFADGYRK